MSVIFTSLIYIYLSEYLGNKKDLTNGRKYRFYRKLDRLFKKFK